MENIFIFHPENTMCNVSAEGTFEKREIKKSRDHRNLRRQLKLQNVIIFLAYKTKISRV